MVDEMRTIVEVDESGALHLPAELLPESAPHTRYSASMQGEQVVVALEKAAESFWKTATPESRAREFLRWAESHEGGVGLSDQAVSRDSIYD